MLEYEISNIELIQWKKISLKIHHEDGVQDVWWLPFGYYSQTEFCCPPTTFLQKLVAVGLVGWLPCLGFYSLGSVWYQ